MSIPIRENESVYIHVDTYLNNSTFVLGVTQHGVTLAGFDQVVPFYDEGMNVYFNPEKFGGWVPDSYYKKVVIKVTDCGF